jgi:hypothetical protein
LIAPASLLVVNVSISYFCNVWSSECVIVSQVRVIVALVKEIDLLGVLLKDLSVGSH